MVSTHCNLPTKSPLLFFLVLPKVDLVVMVAPVLLQVVTSLLLWLFETLKCSKAQAIFT